MLTTRLAKMKKELFDKEGLEKKEWWGDGTTILNKPGILEEPLIIRKAKALEYICSNMPVQIKQDELIVGQPNMAMCGFGFVYPEYATKEEKEMAANNTLNEFSVWGHHPANYEKLLKLGLKGIRNEITIKINEILSKTVNEQKKGLEKLYLYRAMIICLDSVKTIAKRYSELALKKSFEENNKERSLELIRISEICAQVPEKKAETFYEALQSFWLTYTVFHSDLSYLPAGRSDQYLYPFYKHDIDKGILTEIEAKNLIGCWLLKFSSRLQLKKELWENHYSFGNFSQGGDPKDPSSHIVLDAEEDYNYGISANHWLMNMILAGQDKEGKDATNELSYLILNTHAELELVAPVLSVRMHKNTPDKYYKNVAEILSRGGSGEPAIFNDEKIIEGLIKSGVPIEDARNYSNDGCWEIMVPGKSESAYFHIELLLLLEYTLNRGKSILRERMEGIDTGDPLKYKNYKELYSAVLKQIEYAIDRIMKNKIKYYGQVYKIAPVPLLSAMMDDCIEKGLDVTQGGSHYKFFMPMHTGVSHCVDSLAAIKKLVFDEKKVELSRIIEAMQNNFEGNESLRQLLINRAPKYGNDDDYADKILVSLLNDVEKILDKWRKKIPWLMLNSGIGTFESYARYGRTIGASADGRKAKEAIASNFSPSLSMNLNGPTAAIRSATKIDLAKFMSGAPVDLSINANEVSGTPGLNKLKNLIKSFVDIGGNILTVTVSSEKVLREAQAHPDKNRTLRVRLGGFSAYFILLPQYQQEIIIKRLKNF